MPLLIRALSALLRSGDGGRASCTWPVHAMGGTSLSRPWAGALGLKRLPDAKLNTAKPFAGTTVHNDAHIEAYWPHRGIVT